MVHTRTIRGELLEASIVRSVFTSVELSVSHRDVSTNARRSSRLCEDDLELISTFKKQ